MKVINLLVLLKLFARKISKVLKIKEFFLAAVKKDPDSIKYAHSSIQRDPDVLVAAGMNHTTQRTQNKRRHKNYWKVAFAKTIRSLPSRLDFL